MSIIEKRSYFVEWGIKTTKESRQVKEGTIQKEFISILLKDPMRFRSGDPQLEEEVAVNEAQTIKKKLQESVGKKYYLEPSTIGFLNVSRL